MNTALVSSFPKAAFPGAFVGANPNQPIGKNATLLRKAPDVISALGPKVTVGELRNRFGMSLSKLASMPLAERAALLGTIDRGKNPAVFGARAGATGLGRKRRGAKKSVRGKRPLRKAHVRKPVVHRAARAHKAHAAKKPR